MSRSTAHVLAYRLAQFFRRRFRITTLGSRALVVRDSQVLLVRMTYVNGWFLPGGGVNRGESFHDAALREVREECGLAASHAELFGLYHSRKGGKSDHVALYVVTEFEAITGARPDPEIAESRFFNLRALPEGVTPATQRRIAEYLQTQPRSNEW